MTARDGEMRVLSIWPGLHTVAMGDWLIRTDPAPIGRRAKRANSALAMGHADRPTAEAITLIERFYTERSQRPLAQLEPGTGVAADFAAAGWAPLGVGDSFFQVAPLSRVRRLVESTGARDGPPTARVQACCDQARATARVSVSGAAVASGSAAVDSGWLALHGLETATSMRRRGMARAVLAALLDWGAERGADTCWLHVEADNRAALALYGGLGFRTHHSCTYLTPVAQLP